MSWYNILSEKPSEIRKSLLFYEAKQEQKENYK